MSIAWSAMNRSPLIRIPAARGAGTRVEFRSPDGASNPYLVMALCLAAGLDGIKNKLMPPKQVGRNMYMLTEEQLRSMKIGELPRTLGEACAAFEEDLFLQNILGPHIAGKFLEAKKREWNEYCEHVSQWEIDEYLYKF